jgi:nicotinamide-nucleotide amidase
MTPEVVERIKAVEKICRTRSWTLGVAESCTGGLLSSWICSQPGVSSFFAGSVVSYARTVKQQILHVPAPLIKTHGEVSLPTAVAMAKGLRKSFGCDWSLSITGIAGPAGGTPEKPVGFVCLAVVGPGFENSVHKQFPASGGREDIQRQAALFAFDLLLNAMR